MHGSIPLIVKRFAQNAWRYISKLYRPRRKKRKYP